MNRFVIPAMACVVFLAACATPGELRQKSADLDETTTAAPEHVAGCIGDKLETVASIYRGRLSSRPTSIGYSISIDQTMPGLYATGGTDTIILVDITKIGGKTRVQLFSHFLTGPAPENIITPVKTCL